MIELVRMRRRDLRRVMEIENVVFPEPWSHKVFVSELAIRHGRAYRVAREGRLMVGYIGLMFVEDEAHVTTVAVAPGYQGRGFGKQILFGAIEVARNEGARCVSLEVAVGNLRAQALYQRFGFAPLALRKGYYQLTGEDAYVMWVYEIDTPAYGQRLEEIRRTFA